VETATDVKSEAASVGVTQVLPLSVDVYKPEVPKGRIVDTREFVKSAATTSPFDEDEIEAHRSKVGRVVCVKVGGTTGELEAAISVNAAVNTVGKKNAMKGDELLEEKRLAKKRNVYLIEKHHW